MQFHSTPPPRRQPFLPKDSSSKRFALLLTLIAVSAGLAGAWFLQLQAEANRRAQDGPASTQPGAVGEFEAIEKIQIRADIDALDGFGRDSVLRFQGIWRTRTYPMSNDQLSRLPFALVVQNEPGTKRSPHTVRVDHQIWSRMAARLKVPLDPQAGTAFAGSLVRPDGVRRAVFVDVRFINTELPALMRIESRITVCTLPEPGIDLTIARGGDWSPLLEFDRAGLFTSRAARVQFNGTPLLEAATLLLLDDAGTPTRFRITIDNTDGAKVERLE